MVLMSRSLWRAVILLSLVPTLLLWPALHLHPALEHRNGPNGAHTHHAIVHADFFPSSADDHSEPHDGQSSPDDTEPRSLTQITLPALSSRGVPSSTPARERVLDAEAVQELLAAILLSSQPWIARDYALPALDFALLPTTPRAPPFPA